MLKGRGIRLIRGKEQLGVRFNTYRFKFIREEFENLLGALVSNGHIARCVLDGLEHGEFEIYYNSQNYQRGSFRRRRNLVEGKILDYLKGCEDPNYGSRHRIAEEAIGGPDATTPILADAAHFSP